MKRAIKFVLLGAAFALALAALPAATPAVNAQEGGTIIESTFGGGPATLHNLFCNDTACRAVVQYLYPGTLYVDPATASIVQTGPGALAESWEVVDEGRTVIVRLRQGLTWSDGTPITSQEYLYSWRAINNPDAGVVNAGLYTQRIESIEAPDDYTVIFHMVDPSCEAINAISIPLVPSHILGEDFAALRNQDFATNPTVNFGPFRFQEFRSGDQTSLVRNEDYPDASQGRVIPDGYIQKVVPDQTVQVDQFLAGQITLMDSIPPARLAEVLERGDEGTLQVFQYAGRVWDYMAMNFADPTNPQNGLDEDGNPIPQGEHPVLGDVRVRRAIALAIDVDAIINGAVFGRGTRMATMVIPTAWILHPDLEPLPYDPDESVRLLEEAGWMMGPDGIRVKDGVRMSFQLFTNQGNARRTAIGEIVRDQLRTIGIEVDFQTIDFNVLIDRFRSQTVDAWILGWQGGYPYSPDGFFTQLYSRGGDTVGTGSNSMSWSNPRVDELIRAARTLPGCDPAERAALYWELQELFQQDLPEVPLFALDAFYAAQTNVVGWDPYPNNWNWNIDTWSITDVSR